MIHNEFIGGDLDGKALWPPLINMKSCGGLIGDDHSYLRRRITDELDAFVDAEIDEQQAKVMVLGRRNGCCFPRCRCEWSNRHSHCPSFGGTTYGIEEDSEAHITRGYN